MTRHMWKRLTMAAACALSVPCAHADVIMDWNTVLVQTIRDSGGPPCPIARAYAMMHAAMYDAVNSIDRTHQPYLVELDAPEGASMEAAAAAAAYRVLSALYPNRQSIYDQALSDSLNSVPDGAGEADGVELGFAVADALIAHRAHDGTQSEPSYTLVDKPGSWRPTFPDFSAEPFNPNWGNTMPWTMIQGQQFRPKGPLNMKNLAGLVHCNGYAAHVNEVKAIGSRNSAVRTADQTQIAFFWANDVNGTCKPPGQLNLITQVVARDRQLTMVENARLFALVNLALADAGLVAWDAKYNTAIDLWRPITAIRMAAIDGNPKTQPDPVWEPLNPFTPPFPSYVSGHATFAATHAAVMADFFGTDHVTFTIDSEDPYFQALPDHHPRTYHSFSEAAWENAMSRLYLGVHFRFDAVDGNQAGAALGHYVFAHTLGTR